LFGFGMGGGADVARGTIGGVTGGPASALKRLAQLCVRVDYRIGGQLIGSPIGVVADVLTGQACSLIRFVPS
jgi:hypothetical protein